MAYKALTLAEVSGLLLLMLIACAMAAAVLLVEACYSKWRGTSSAHEEATCCSKALTSGNWPLICPRHGTVCLPLRLRHHLSDTSYRKLTAALSRAVAPDPVRNAFLSPDLL